MTTNDSTHFGFKSVDASEKASMVASVFKSVADQYDLMNDVMSLGLHRLWKRIALRMVALRPSHQVLDLASGTGDLAMLMAKEVGENGHVFMTDVNPEMLARGKARVIDSGLLGSITCSIVDAENIPFETASMDRVTIAFGLRNVTHKEKALAEMFRVLKPGGRALILEFSKLGVPWLSKLYDEYSFRVIPKLGAWIAKDAESYRYLVESIRMHPDQDTLKKMMEAAAFEDVHFRNLQAGIVAIHVGYKY